MPHGPMNVKVSHVLIHRTVGLRVLNPQMFRLQTRRYPFVSCIIAFVKVCIYTGSYKISHFPDLSDRVQACNLSDRVQTCNLSDRVQTCNYQFFLTRHRLHTPGLLCSTVPDQYSDMAPYCVPLCRTSTVTWHLIVFHCAGPVQ